jgi:hypothetical protein
MPNGIPERLEGLAIKKQAEEWEGVKACRSDDDCIARLADCISLILSREFESSEKRKESIHIHNINDNDSGEKSEDLQ